MTIKTDSEIEIMRRGGKISAGALKAVLAVIKPGVTLSQLDKTAQEYIEKHGAEPGFKKVKGYHYTTCINLNEGLVHGIPDEEKIKEGDLVKVDLGAFYQGFHTDISYTIEVGSNKEEHFLDAGKKALDEAVKQCLVGKSIGDISSSIQKEIEEAGYTVSRELIGHGVGRELHEGPSIPGYGAPGSGMKLKKGMTLAIEVIYQKGSPTLAYEKDGWTIRTKDRSLAGLFEHTVAVLDTGFEVLTTL